MDPISAIGLAANVLQLADTAFTLSKNLYGFSSSIASAPAEVKRLAEDLQLFSDSLATLAPLLERSKAWESDALYLQIYRSTNDVIKRSKKLHDDIGKLFQKLGKKSVRARLGFVMGEAKIKALVASLAEMKIHLGLVFTGLGVFLQMETLALLRNADRGNAVEHRKTLTSRSLDQSNDRSNAGVVVTGPAQINDVQTRGTQRMVSMQRNLTGSPAGTRNLPIGTMKITSQVSNGHPEHALSAQVTEVKTPRCITIIDQAFGTCLKVLGDLERSLSSFASEPNQQLGVERLKSRIVNGGGCISNSYRSHLTECGTRYYDLLSEKEHAAELAEVYETLFSTVVSKLHIFTADHEKLNYEALDELLDGVDKCVTKALLKLDYFAYIITKGAPPPRIPIHASSRRAQNGSGPHLSDFQTSWETHTVPFSQSQNIQVRSGDAYLNHGEPILAPNASVIRKISNELNRDTMPRILPMAPSSDLKTSKPSEPFFKSQNSRMSSVKGYRAYEEPTPVSEIKKISNELVGETMPQLPPILHRAGRLSISSLRSRRQESLKYSYMGLDVESMTQITALSVKKGSRRSQSVGSYSARSSESLSDDSNPSRSSSTKIEIIVAAHSEGTAHDDDNEEDEKNDGYRQERRPSRNRRIQFLDVEAEKDEDEDEAEKDEHKPNDFIADAHLDDLEGLYKCPGTDSVPTSDEKAVPVLDRRPTKRAGRPPKPKLHVSPTPAGHSSNGRAPSGSHNEQSEDTERESRSNCGSHRSKGRGHESIHHSMSDEYNELIETRKAISLANRRKIAKLGSSSRRQTHSAELKQAPLRKEQTSGGSRRNSSFAEPSYAAYSVPASVEYEDSAGDIVQDRLRAAENYRTSVGGPPTKLTAESLKKANRRSQPASSDSARSSGSRDKGERQRSSVTTRTTRSIGTGAGEEDITIKLKGIGKIKIAGAEIDYDKDTELNIRRGNGGGDGGAFRSVSGDSDNSSPSPSENIIKKEDLDRATVAYPTLWRQAFIKLSPTNRTQLRPAIQWTFGQELESLIQEPESERCVMVCVAQIERISLYRDPSPFVQILQILDAIIAVQSTIGLEMTAPAWISVCALLTKIRFSKVLSHTKKLLGHVSNIVAMIARYAALENIYHNWKGLILEVDYQDALINLCLFILEYICVTVEFLDAPFPDEENMVDQYYDRVMAADLKCRGFVVKVVGSEEMDAEDVEEVEDEDEDGESGSGEGDVSEEK